MSELDNIFNEAISVEDIEDFQSSSVKPIANDASNRNLAAHASLLSDAEDVSSRYQEVLSSLQNNPSTELINSLFEVSDENTRQSSKEALTGIIADNSLPDEVRVSAAEKISTLDSQVFSISNTLSTESIVEDDIVNEDAVEKVRLNLSDNIERMNFVKSEQQKILNVVAASNEDSTASNFTQIMEAITPFTEMSFLAEVNKKLSSGEKGTVESYWDVITGMGGFKMSLKEMVASTPVEERKEISEKVAKAIQESSDTLLHDRNHFLADDLMRTILEEDYYGSGSLWVDNIVGVLDLVGIGQLFGKGVKGGSKAVSKSFGSSEVVQRIRRNSVISTRQPSSVADNLKDTNSKMSRDMHDEALKDETGEVAQAVYGTSREDALVSDIAPQVSSPDGAVSARVSTPHLLSDIETAADQEILKFVNEELPRNLLTQEEFVRANTKVVNDLSSAFGLANRSEMDSIGKDVGDAFEIDAMYGPTKSGYVDPEVALDSAKIALRDYGIPDGNFTLMVRDGGDIVPALKGDLSNSGEYFVKVKHRYEYNINDILEETSDLTVKRNMFDRIFPSWGSHKQGTLQRVILDPASALDPVIIRSANVGVDKSSRLEQLFLEGVDEFAGEFRAYPGHVQDALVNEIKEANQYGRDYNYTNLISKGLKEGEVNSLKKFKTIFDTHYVLENRDLVKTRKARGEKEFIHSASDTKLFVSPVSKSSLSNSRYYDAEADLVKTVTKDELDEIYDLGGEFGRLQRSIDIEGEEVDLVLATNRAGGGYLKELGDSTQILNYRKGYYPVRYKQPWFIDKVVTKSDGTKARRAVQTAGNKTDAAVLAKAANTSNTDETVEYVFREDKNIQGSNSVSDDDYWDLASAKGRVSQRVRGQRLESSTDKLEALDQTHIMGPVDTAVMAARSISRRVPMRPVLETMKLRAMRQYEDFLDSKNGKAIFPTDRNSIKYRGQGNQDGKRLADARTTFEYINYLESGYINSLDDLYRATFNKMGDLIGGTKFNKLEPLLRNAAKANPTGSARSVAFNLLIVPNIFRQFPLQLHQAIQLLPNFTKQSLKILPQSAAMLSLASGIKPPKLVLKGSGMTLGDAEAAFKHWQNSGLPSSISKQNLVRGVLNDLSDELMDSRVKGGVNAIANRTYRPVLNTAKKVGFDAGEYGQSLLAFLAHRQKAIDDGLDLNNKAVLDDIVGKTRNYTGNMNRAGDFPQNQNAFNLLFQFMQFPHKMLLNMTTNRGLSKWERGKLAGFNFIMFGVPTAVVLETIKEEDLPEDPNVRGVIVHGLEGHLLNKSLELLTGDDVALDWKSSIAPTSLYGQMDFMHKVMTSDMGELLSGTPSGSLFFGKNPRVTNFYRTVARMTNVIDDFENPTEFDDVAISFGEMFSGFSNAMKGAYSWKAGVVRNSFGNVVDPDTSKTEALHKVFGIRTLDEATTSFIKRKVYLKSKEHKDDVLYWYKELKRHLNRKGITPDQVQRVIQTSSEAWRAWGEESEFSKKILSNAIKRDIESAQVDMFLNILRAETILPTNELKDLVNRSPFGSQEAKQRTLQRIDLIEQSRGLD